MRRDGRAGLGEILVLETPSGEASWLPGPVCLDHRSRRDDALGGNDQGERRSGVGSSLMRPIRFLPRLSAATMTGTVSLDRPVLPREIPPTKVSSISTAPVSGSRSGTTIARRSLCTHTQAASYGFNPRTRCSPAADTPFFRAVTNQTAANQVRTGVRVRSKIVPEVADVRREHAVHIHRPSAVRHETRSGTFRAHEPVRPPQLCEAVEAFPVRGEPVLELEKHRRVSTPKTGLLLGENGIEPKPLQPSRYPVLLMVKRAIF